MAQAKHKILFVTEVLDKATGKLRRIGKTTEMINKSGHKVTATWRKVGNQFKIVRKNIEHISSATKRGAMRFFGLGMGMLFMGMAINRFLTQFANSAINAYKIMGAEQTIFNIKTNELAASWEFFKFSLIDALSQSPLFLTLINWLISLINWFGRLPESERLIIALSVAFGIVGTKIMSVIGQLGLFVVGLEMMKPGIVVAMANAFWGLTSAILSNPVTWVAIAIISLILLVGYLINTFDGFNKVLKFFAGFAIWAFALIGDAMIEFLLMPIRAFIKLLDLAITGYNILTGKHIRTISERIPDKYRPGMITRAAEGYLKNAEWFQPVRQDVQEKGTFGEYAAEVGGRIAKELSDALAGSIEEAFDKSLDKHGVTIPSTEQ